MKFPKDYPMNPPFVRVLRPKFQFLTGRKDLLPFGIMDVSRDCHM